MNGKKTIKIFLYILRLTKSKAISDIIIDKNPNIKTFNLCDLNELLLLDFNTKKRAISISNKL
tara:strand:+ start:127 stop:315 length:189 start_codon:yes stop_codon:yes gene_type:complete